MSIEELRDNYKNLRQFKEKKLNGSTYRKKPYINKNDHFIALANHAHTKPHEYSSLDELNASYGLNRSYYNYSLNKKKRWQISNLLSDNMKTFNEENLDVRLFETVKRTGRNKPNLIKIERSKGQKVTIKNTFADLNSIIAKERHDQQERINPPRKEPKLNRFKLKQHQAKSSKPIVENRIVIKDHQSNSYSDSDSDTDNDDNIEYFITYEPKETYIKNGQANYKEKITHKKTFIKRYYSVSDDETLKRDLSQIQDELGDESPDEDQEETKNSIEITLNDLIENFSKVLIKNHDKKSKKEQAKSRALTELDSAKSNKIYHIERQMSHRINSNTASILSPKFCMPLRVNLQLLKSSVESTKLKETYGLKYNEAFKCWPRRFNLNISDDLKQVLGKNIETVVWLRFQETSSLEKTCFFDVSICANLINCESISIENINPCETHSLEFVVEKALEMLGQLSKEVFKIEEATTPKTATGYNFNPTIGDLPVISSSPNETKNIEELKLEFINSRQIQRLNSLEVLKEENKESTLTVLKSIQNRMECVLCFEEKSVESECTLLKKCGHCVCNECFQYYCESRLSNTLANAGKFPCPSCEDELEISLLINFASNANLLDLYLKLTIEKVWFVLNNYKWCPSPNCSKILKVDLITNTYGTVSCKCGYKMCLRCNNPPHFPAECKQIANYYNELNKSNSLQMPVQDKFYTAQGKRCPKCNIFMEKMYGCNQMVCSLCNTTFCWNCVRSWDEHLKLNQGSHGCKEKETNNFIDIEFVGKTKKSKGVNLEKKCFQDSVYHRQMRLSISNKQYRILEENLIKTIDFNSLIDIKTSEQILSKTEKIVENSKNINEKREEIRIYLKKIASFLNELHFICEHGFVLVRDKKLSTETRRLISSILKRIEVIIWRINYSLEYGSGIGAVDEIRKSHENGISCIRLLNKIEK